MLNYKWKQKSNKNKVMTIDKNANNAQFEELDELLLESVASGCGGCQPLPPTLSVPTLPVDKK